MLKYVFHWTSLTPVKGTSSGSCQIDISQYVSRDSNNISVKYTEFRLTLTPSDVRILCRSAVGNNGYFSSERQLYNDPNYEFPWLIRFGCADNGKSFLDTNTVRLTCRVIN